jgi:hypothetical protein
VCFEKQWPSQSDGRAKLFLVVRGIVCSLRAFVDVGPTLGDMLVCFGLLYDSEKCSLACSSINSPPLPPLHTLPNTYNTPHQTKSNRNSKATYKRGTNPTNRGARECNAKVLLLATPRNNPNSGGRGVRENTLTSEPDAEVLDSPHDQQPRRF